METWVRECSLKEEYLLNWQFYGMSGRNKTDSGLIEENYKETLLCLADHLQHLSPFIYPVERY